MAFALGILSFVPTVYSTRRLQEAAEARGYRAHVFPSFNLTLAIGEQSGVLVDGKELEGLGALIPRVGYTASYFGIAVVRQFELLGGYSVNSSAAISISRDKLHTLQLLSSRGIPVPRTAFALEQQEIERTIDCVGGAPVVVKLLHGTRGLGVTLAHTKKEAEASVEAFQLLQQQPLVQEFIAESRGRDIRAVVVGSQVVAAMRRIAPEGEFRSNVHRGAAVEPLEISDEVADLAVRAAQAVGLEVAGVDILESKRGPLILEVNSSPGLRGIESATKIDVAGKIIDHIRRQCG